MIGYAITGYDVSHIRCSADDAPDGLPMNVKAGSIAIAVNDDNTENCYVFWEGQWYKFKDGR